MGDLPTRPGLSRTLLTSGNPRVRPCPGKAIPALPAADPGTTDIVLPITLQDGTLTNTTPGGHEMSTDVDNISGLSLFAGPALPKHSYTCAKAKTSLACG